jgi:hypothetical protein
MPFTLDHLLFVSLKVYDVFGREVAILINKELPPGSYTPGWDAGGFTSGVYYYRLQTKTYGAVKKMLLLR